MSWPDELKFTLQTVRAIRAGRGAYPVQRREQDYWEQQLGGYGALVDKFGWLSLASFISMPITWLVYPDLFLIHILVVEAFGALICLPAGAAVVREKQAGTWDSLRITGIGMREILIAKLLGVYGLASHGMRQLARTRLWGVLVTAPMFALFTAAPDAGRIGVERPALAVPMLGTAVLLFILHPILTTLFTCTLSLWISTAAGTQMNAISGSLIAFGLLLLFGALPGWLAVRAGALRPLFMQGPAGQQLLADFEWLLPLAGLVLVRSIVGAGAGFAMLRGALEQRAV